MVDLARFAFQNGRVQVAVALLEAFILHVEAQAGIHIAAEHAQHMVMHAKHVIAALEVKDPVSGSPGCSREGWEVFRNR